MQIRPSIMAFVIVSVLIIGAVIMNANKRVQPSAEQSAVLVQDTNAQIVVNDPALAEKPASDVAPETVAALARVGLPATNLAPIRVVAKARPPIVLPNPLNRKTQ